MQGDTLADWRKYASILHEENMALKDELEQGDRSAVIACLRTQVHEKDKKLAKMSVTLQHEKNNHTRQIEKLNAKNDSLHVKLHKCEQDGLLNKSALKSAEDKVVLLQGQLATSRQLCTALREKCSKLEVHREELMKIDRERDMLLISQDAITMQAKEQFERTMILQTNQEHKNNHLQKEIDELKVEKEALLMIIRHNGIKDTTEEICKLKLINKELVDRLKKLTSEKRDLEKRVIEGTK